MHLQVDVNGKYNDMGKYGDVSNSISTTKGGNKLSAPVMPVLNEVWPLMNLGGSSYSGNTNTESACVSNCGGNTVGLKEHRQKNKKKSSTDD